MRSLIILVAWLGAACTGNPVAPVAPPQSEPEAPAVPVPAPPKAVLVIGGGEVTPPLGIRGFTDILFDGSQSTGEALTYVLEFGDGVSSAEPVARHRSDVPGPLDARLTVTDRYGRSDSTMQTHYRHRIATDGDALWWLNEVEAGRRRIERKLVLAQDGATLSGQYRGPEGNKRLTGALSGDRAIRLRTDDGVIELVGAMDLHSSDDPYVVLRLSVRGGLADGSLLDFRYVQPY